MSIAVEIAAEATLELLSALSGLLPQLTGRAAALTAADLARLIARPGLTLFIARDEAGTIVGTASLVEIEIPTGRAAWLEDVVVDDAARGQGVGAALTLAVVEQAREHGNAHLNLTSGSHRQAAHRLYERLGFEQRDTRIYRHRLGR